MTVNQVEEKAQAAARAAFDYAYNHRVTNAREIAEYVDEPTVLLEALIKAFYVDPKDNIGIVAELLDKEVRNYANQQAELAYNAVINEPR